MKRNWRTSLWGGIGVFGTSLMGVALCYHFKDDPVLYWTIFAGVILSAVGRAMTAFSAADAKVVAALQKSFDTDHFTKPGSGSAGT